ncbi:hypothetical protein D3273_24705 [Lichenibacterium minor]|uniref:Uncharacterized protein n=1 Tax=Lichenibacterium minor TaxID=2316528 RepID=A0A4V1RTY9_9HYPH|nr:hypothetical protein [Lichenibacterium minor]RYC29314.1 hypothetical protein D3273_24705 [Lichenibacterium minor]
MSSTAQSITISTAAQLATVSRSTDRAARARAYATRLGAHAAEIRAQLDAAAGGDAAGPLRGELIEVDRQHRQAVEILTGVEAEHARHEADFRALHCSDGAARAKLADTHAARAAAVTASDATAAVLDRATAHAEAVERRLADARSAEARYDADATARLHAALRDGTEAPAATEAFSRTSPGLEDDARAARAAEARAAAEHRAKLTALAETERQVRGAADAVLLAEADSMAREVAALDARADLLRARLTTYAARTRGDHVQPEAVRPDPTRNAWSPPPPSLVTMATEPRVASTPAIAAALVDRTFVKEAPRDTSGVARAWDSFAAALAINAEAETSFTPNPPGPLLAPTASWLPASRFPASWEPQPAPEVPANAA